MGQFDVITIGDSTIDTFVRIHDATIECDVNSEDCKICISYGDKIPVDSIAYGVAGNAANVAVGAAKIGASSAIYTNLGDDNHGQTIKQALKGADVASDYIVVNKGKKSNLSVVLTFQGERTIFVYHQDWYYRLPDLSPCKWLYFTSCAATFTESNIVDEVCKYVDKTHAKLAFAPGTYQMKADIKRYPRLLEKCDLLIFNREEAKEALNIDPVETVPERDLLAKLLLLGPRNVVITDGDEGSYATDGQTNFKMGVFPTQVVEKTGAGDAYSSGLVSALALGKSLEEGMLWGTINASSAVKHIGTQVGLMHRADIEKHAKIVPELVATTF
ncbi:MAG: carbohydrate kinase family protein [Candidatus Curtissbacteria bacterium]|nr:carbohydrate kinase family protein [Candidatus Curtissbacteria bacterium]